MMKIYFLIYLERKYKEKTWLIRLFYRVIYFNSNIVLQFVYFCVYVIDKEMKFIIVIGQYYRI